MRKLSIILVVMLAITLSACSTTTNEIDYVPNSVLPVVAEMSVTSADLAKPAAPSKYAPSNYIEIQADVDKPLTSLDEVEKFCDIIVKGHILDDSEEKYQIGLDGHISFGHTVSTLVITESYVGNYKKGDTLKLGEVYYTQKENGDLNLYYRENYLPSEVGKEYLFFLVSSEKDSPLEGAYFPAYRTLGRYPFIEKSVSANSARRNVDTYTNYELSLGTGDSENYRTIYNEAIGKYMK